MAAVPHIYPRGCVFSSISYIKNKHITIMGLGLNGGGEACVKFFLKHGAYVTVTDMKTAEQLKTTIESISNDTSLDKSRLRYVLGQHRIEDFAEADCVIKNPGVKIEGNKYLAAAKAIETDISIFLSLSKAPIIAVTGSKGKSSTVSAIDFGLRQAGFTSFLGGNITVSPLTFLEKTDGTTPVVLELSSWQLADLRGRGVLKPKIAIITKIVPDHQNWYGDMDSYVADKKIIYSEQDSTDYTILDNDDDGYLKETATPVPNIKCWGDLFASETKGIVLRYSKRPFRDNEYGVYQLLHKESIVGYERLPENLMSVYAQNHSISDEQIMGSLSVPGEHMKTNVLNAALVLRIMGVSPEQTISILGTWKGIAHRLEHFHTWNIQFENNKKNYNVPVMFYNDSCATVPEAAAAASQAFEKRVVLIAGGTDKGLSFLPLAGTITGEVGQSYKPLEIYLLSGTGTDKLTELLDARHVEYFGPFDSLEVLLGILKANLISPVAAETYKAQSDKDSVVVVFSPGATSFGMFTNEFDRGDKFKTSVKNIF